MEKLALCGRDKQVQNCQDFVLSANDVINIAEGTTQDQEMIKTIRRLVQVDHDTTAAVNLLATVNSRAAKRMALEYYLKKTMWNAAQQVLNSLPNSTQDEQFFKQLYTIKRDLAQSNRSIFQITAAEEATITNIANHRSRTSFEAQAILYLVRQIEFPVPMEHLPLPLPAYTGTLPTIHFKNDVGNATATMPIKVYPNPAKDFVQVEVLSACDGGYFTLYAIDGKKCLERPLVTGTNLLQTTDLPSGIYYYTISSNTQIIQQHKIVLLK